jgi:iron complex transport system permease protein
MKAQLQTFPILGSVHCIFDQVLTLLLPYSAVVGSIFLIIADTMARTLVSPLEIPVGIITALAGAPFFLYLLSRKKREM